jgi:hypothetical protein
MTKMMCSVLLVEPVWATAGELRAVRQKRGKSRQRMESFIPIVPGDEI